MYVMCRCLQCMGIVRSVEILGRSVNAFGSLLPATSALFFLHLKWEKASSVFVTYIFPAMCNLKHGTAKFLLRYSASSFFVLILLPRLLSLFLSIKFMI